MNILLYKSTVIFFLSILLGVWMISAIADPDTNIPYHNIQSTLKINSDGTAMVAGVVVENYLGCVRDIWCYLRVDVPDGEVRVIYDNGEGEGKEGGCYNQENGDIGMIIKPGTKIKALGSYNRKKSLHLINVCTSSDYYLTHNPDSFD